MKTTRWFIEYWNKQHCWWLPYRYNPSEDFVSEAAALDVLNKVDREELYRVVSRKVEVAAKIMVKVKSSVVELEVDGNWYRRKEEGASVQWSQYNTEARWFELSGWVQTYSTPDGMEWCEQDEDCCILPCEQPEIEQVWREYIGQL